MQYLGDKLENEMGGACGMCGEKREIHAGFGWETWRKLTGWEDPGIDLGGVCYYNGHLRNKMEGYGLD